MKVMMTIFGYTFQSRNNTVISWNPNYRLSSNIMAMAKKTMMTLTMMRKIHTSVSNSKVIPSNLKGKGKSSQEWLTRHLNDPYVKKAQELNYRARSAFKLIEIDEKAKILKPGLTVIECGAAPGAWTQVIVNRINSDGKALKKRIGTVIGIDLLPIAPLKGAVFLAGCDFTNPKTLQRIQEILRRGQQDLEPAINNVSINAGVKSETAEIIMKTSKDNDDNDGSKRNTDSLNPTAATEAVVQNDPQDKTDPLSLVDVILSDMAPNASGQRDTDHFRIVKLVESALVFAVENGKPGGHFLAKVWDGSEMQRVEQLVSKYYDKVTRQKPPSSRNDSSEIFILGKFKK